MVMLETDYNTLLKYVGRKISVEELEEVLFKMGFELEQAEEDIVRIDITPERIDMLSVQGCARAIRQYLGIDPGLKKYDVRPSGIEIFIDESVRDVRPYTVAAVVKGIKFDDEKIKELIWLQEKVHETYARGRVQAAIGVYPLDPITPPIKYYAEDSEKIRFVPLGAEKEMTGSQVLREHPTGVKYAHLLKGEKKYPVFTDAKGKVLSMPPIINSEELGKVTEKTQDVFIECSGSNLTKLNLVLNLLVTSLADMGGKIESVRVHAYGQGYSTPNLTPWKITVDSTQVEKWSGIQLNAEEMKNLLERMGYSADVVSEEEVEVGVPAYRADVLHPVDIIDDLLRAYGFDNIPARLGNVMTVGGIIQETKKADDVREILTGLGFQEAITLALTSKEEQYQKMGVQEEPHVSLQEQKEKSINMVRTWLLPELMKVLQNNRSKPFPQRVFEVGDVVIPDNSSDTLAKNQQKVACVISHDKANYSEAKSVLENLAKAMNWNVKLEEEAHGSMIQGRTAAVFLNGKKRGVIGEIHPSVIENFELEHPVSGFELILE